MSQQSQKSDLNWVEAGVTGSQNLDLDWVETGTSTTKKSAKSKQLALPLGVHLSQVSTKGKIPTCRHCRSVIEGRGTWHAIQVLPNSTIGLPAAARNEYHYHCKCVLKVFQHKEIEQLIDIVNSKTDINGVDRNIIIDSINTGQE